MVGLASIYAFDDSWRISRFTYYALLALQHRGQESAGIAVYNGRLSHHLSRGFVDNVFNDDVLHMLQGWLSVGYVSSGVNSTYMSYVNKPTELVICTCRLADDLALRLSNNLSRYDPFEAVEKLVREVKQPVTFIALTGRGEAIVFRDFLGLNPLSIGAYGFDYGAVASETSALECIGADPKGDVKPGEAYLFTPYSVRRETLFKTCRRLCSFEYVYLARPDSVIDGIPVYDVRYRIGVELAKEWPIEADYVVGVPDTALPFAIAYAQTLGLQFHIGFISTGRKYRTAIKPSIFERIVGVQLKLNPIRSVFRGRRIVIVDDSVIRGTTTRNIVSILKNRVGAREVHVLVGSPKVMYQCPYGVDVPPRDELIAANLSDEEVSYVTGADSIHWLSINGLQKALGIGFGELCLGCFTGSYPEVDL
jgi:amidophosphoribosyltransferase